MIKPSRFDYNDETASDNVYQNKSNISAHIIARKAELEFKDFMNLLIEAGINIIEFVDDLESHTPDSIFPNNWISTHANGFLFLYPMFAVNRRLERRMDIVHFLQKNFIVSNVLDEAQLFEEKNQFLEGTGSLVLDRENKIAYACLSSRTNKKLFTNWCEKMSFQGISFQAKDKGREIYHTNVMMSVCKHMVFICLNSIVENDKKIELLSLFQKTNKEVVSISIDQMNSFLGNVIELENGNKESFLIMSTCAFNSLNSNQMQIIEKYVKIIHSPLDTIEYFGGGSARCMIAEVFLEPR